MFAATAAIYHHTLCLTLKKIKPERLGANNKKQLLLWTEQKWRKRRLFVSFPLIFLIFIFFSSCCLLVLSGGGRRTRDTNKETNIKTADLKGAAALANEPWQRAKKREERSKEEQEGETVRKWGKNWGQEKLQKTKELCKNKRTNKTKKVHFLKPLGLNYNLIRARSNITSSCNEYIYYLIYSNLIRATRESSRLKRLKTKINNIEED